MQGKTIRVNEGSVALSINQGNQASGGIAVNASDSLEMRRVGSYGFAQSLLITDTITGTSGNLLITAPRLLLQDGGRMSTHTYGSGQAGDISVVADSIQLFGFSALKPATTRSSITSETAGAGQAGDIQVTTRQLNMRDGGSITGASFGTGATGNINVNASESIALAGETAISFSASLLGTVSFNRGNSGSVTVNTSRLSVQNGAGGSASTLGQGNAGILRVNASEQISVSGVSAASGKPGNINASATVLPLSFQKAFGLSALPTGNSGDLIINTPRLDITNGGQVRVNNQGFGNAGNLYITAETIGLDRLSKISASTNSGQGGGIHLQTNLLTLRHGSNIIATAAGTGNGGNITINAPIIVGLENSDIIANAIKGKGGNIHINTQSIFGLKYRDKLTPSNDITVSSEFGINGNVQVNTIGINPANSLNTLPSEVVDSSRQIADRCGSARTGSFVATGRGGIPQDPTKRHVNDRPWHDLRFLTTTHSSIIQPVAIVNPAEPIVEANALQIDASGTISLVAAKPIAIQTAATCGMSESQ